ncbi:hypothetical protein [Pricia sp.]|uniref:hypothetical protein n=1 Tax=Pricia sp. TaxID=2268138 RepID=UPI0035933B0A
MKNYIQSSILLIVAFGMLSCEQERLDPIHTTAEGGGTLNEYVAYDIASTDPTGSNVYGRVVFYKTTLEQTLVQISLYNTVENLMHPALVLEGASGSSMSSILSLDDIDGSTGEFSNSKFFIITNTAFYDSLEGETASLDAHVSIYLSDSDNTIVASGDIGINAMPVATD